MFPLFVILNHFIYYLYILCCCFLYIVPNTGNTKIPVLKAQTRPNSFQSPTPLSLDISFEGPGHRGLESNKLIISLLKTYPSLRPLVLVLKCFLSMKSLCEGFTGGLSSHSLLLLVVRYIQEIDQKHILTNSASNSSNSSSSNTNSNSSNNTNIMLMTNNCNTNNMHTVDNKRLGAGLRVQDLGALLLGTIHSCFILVIIIVIILHV